MVLVDIDQAFARNDNNILPPTTEILLCAAARNLVKSKKLHNWESSNAILLPPFLM